MVAIWRGVYVKGQDGKRCDGHSHHPINDIIWILNYDKMIQSIENSFPNLIYNTECFFVFKIGLRLN